MLPLLLPTDVSTNPATNLCGQALKEPISGLASPHLISFFLEFSGKIWFSYAFNIVFISIDITIVMSLTILIAMKKKKGIFPKIKEKGKPLQ